MEEKRQCPAIKADGERCRVTFGLNPETALCWFHDPVRADERRRTSSLAGKRTAEERRKRARTIHEDEAMQPPATAGEAKKWSAWLAFAAVTGLLDRGTVREAAGAIRVFLSSLEKAEYEAALEEIRAEVRELRGLTKKQKLEVS